MANNFQLPQSGVLSQKITMTGSAIQVRVPNSAVNNQACQLLWIQVPGTNTGSVYVGDASVTSSNGSEIPKGSIFPMHDLQKNAERQGWDLTKIYLTGTNNDVATVLQDY